MVAEPSGPKVSFVDTSQYRGAIDVAKVASAGHVGIFPRTTARTTVDPYWYQTARDTLERGLVCMGRHRIYRSPSVGDQFAVFRREVERVRPGAVGLLICLDSEDDATWAQVEDFEQRSFDRWGSWPVMYYPCWWLRGIGNPALRAGAVFWHSHYASTPGDLCGGRTSLKGQMWQWTNQGTCPGIAPPVDLNWFYGTREQLAALAVGGGDADPSPEEYLAQARKALVTTTGMSVAGGSLLSKTTDIQGGVDRMEPLLGQVDAKLDEALGLLSLPPGTVP